MILSFYKYGVLMIKEQGKWSSLSLWYRQLIMFSKTQAPTTLKPWKVLPPGLTGAFDDGTRKTLLAQLVMSFTLNRMGADIRDNQLNMFPQDSSSS